MPGIVFRPSTIRSRRARNSATIAATESCGPLSASAAAICSKLLVHETLLMISLLYGLDQVRRHDRVAQPPAGHRVRLGEAVEDDRALGHAGQCRDRVVLALVDAATVDLVGEDGDVRVLAHDVRDRGDVLLAQHAARRVVRRVEDDQPCPGVTRARAGRAGPSGSRSLRAAGPGRACRRRSASSTRRSGSPDRGR